MVTGTSFCLSNNWLIVAKTASLDGIHNNQLNLARVAISEYTFLGTLDPNVRICILSRVQ